MKVIDLLNKIANGEELPKKIKFESSKTIYELNDYTQRYIGEYMNNILILEHIDIEILNKEIEIIEDTPKEEKKIPEKLGIINYCESQATSLIHQKVDEIIDYLKSKGE